MLIFFLAILCTTLLPISESMAFARLIHHEKAKTEQLKQLEIKYNELKMKGEPTQNHEISKRDSLRLKSETALSSIDIYKNGKLHMRRYYDWRGYAEIDIEYTYIASKQKDVIYLQRFKWNWPFYEIFYSRNAM